MCRGLALVFVLVLVISSLTLVESALAQTTEPSVPGSPGVGGFSVLFPSNATTLGSPIEVTVVAFYANGYIDTSFTGHVSFSASKGTISPSMSGAFTEGSWRGLINMSEAGSDIVVYVNDGNGHAGKSGPISVYQPSPTPTVPEFSWLAILPFFVSVLLVAVYLKYRNTNHELY
jgi:hypothetical protein